MNEQAWQEFQSPAAAYRGKPFWSWNGRLEKDELLRQIHVMKQMGLGGFFMHSRTGLVTEYLGEEWFDLINACADEAETLGMEAWLYDEDRWPSGSAGGIVTADPQYRMKYLRLRTVPADRFAWSDDLLAAFAANVNGVSYTDCRRITSETPLADIAGATVLAFATEEMACNTFYNGATYLDTLNPAATRKFIEVTHEKYAARCGDRLGRSIRGIFTDEPHRGSVMSTFGGNENAEWLLPWTEKLVETFEARFGYDLVDRLPELFLRLDGRAVSQVKWQYMEHIQRMFLDHFIRPIHDWCEANRLVLTGHALEEGSLVSQSIPCGSMMRCYEYMGAPGIDILREGNRNYWIAKQLDSAARQFGKRWRLSELYGCTGWQMSFESHKAVGDWQALFGVNVRCHHLSWYTMAGQAKRDYPGSILHQSAWYPHYDYVETYFSRLGVLLGRGEPCRDVLVVHPVESVWCQIHPGWSRSLEANAPEIVELEQAHADLFHWLAGAQIDFDYGDEDHLSRHGRVETGAEGPILHLGEAAYRVAVLPRMTTVRSTTLALLEEFVDAGGTVIVTGEPPAHVDALESDRARSLGGCATAVAFARDDIVTACEAAAPSPANVLGADSGESIPDIFCQVRDDAGERIVVALNVSTDTWHRGAVVRIAGQGRVEEWDCVTGHRRAVPAVQKHDCVEVSADFAPSREHAYVLTGEPAAPPQEEPAREVLATEVLAGPFDYAMDEPNVCVLDRAAFRMGDGPWRDEKEILQLDRAVRRELSLPLRTGTMLQPWFTAGQTHEVKTHLTLRFAFHIEAVPTGAVALAIERPQDFEVAVNEQALSTATDSGWWVDPCFRRIEIPTGILTEGENTVELRVGFHDAINLEAMYLLGDFGVRVEGTRRTLTALPETLATGCVTEQGLPFYSGTVRYVLDVPRRPAAGETATLRVPGFEAACLLAVAESAETQIIAWQPYEADVTDLLAAGRLELHAVLTRRNTFGPLHQVPLRTPFYHPGSFTTQGDAFTDDYMLYPAALLAPPEIVFTT